MSTRRSLHPDWVYIVCVIVLVVGGLLIFGTTP